MLEVGKVSQSLSKPYSNILVVGAGLMGAGIAQVAAKSGFQVTLVDRTPEDLDRAKIQIVNSLNKLAKKDGDSENGNTLLDHIHFTTSLSDGSQCDVAIEAVPEKLPIKKEIFQTLDGLLKEEVIIASNTSSLSIAAIGSTTRRPEKVVGMHFFSPVPVMKLVEVVRSVNTSEETIKDVQLIAEKMGKETIIANDYPGFTVNRVLVPMINEAAFLVMEGNDPEEIDRGMMLGTNQPIGPLRLADYVGVDVLLFTLDALIYMRLMVVKPLQKTILRTNP